MFEPKTTEQSLDATNESSSITNIQTSTSKPQIDLAFLKEALAVWNIPASSEVSSCFPEGLSPTRVSLRSPTSSPKPVPSSIASRTAYSPANRNPS